MINSQKKGIVFVNPIFGKSRLFYLLKFYYVFISFESP